MGENRWGLCAVALVVAILAAGCGNDDGGDDADDSPSASTSTVELRDRTGDTELYNRGSRPSDVTVNVDVKAQTVSYDEDGLTIEIVYAEPLDQHQEAAELLTSLKLGESSTPLTLWWFDSDMRPYITGEDEINTGCRVPKAEVDRRAGRVVLTVPTTKRCLGSPPTPKVTLSVTAYRDDTWDRLRDVTVQLP